MASLSIVLTGFLLLLTSRLSCAQTMQDAIGFPEKEENPSLQNKENRQPVYLPSKCSENELFYPGDQKDDWICDCRPSYIYQPATDKCWPAYRQGPCAVGHYLVLPPNSYIPACEKNPCQTDSFVLWNGSCQQLGTTTACAHLYPNASALGVDATTLQVGCVKLSLESRILEPTGATSAAPACPPGCKRDVNRKC